MEHSTPQQTENSTCPAVANNHSIQAQTQRVVPRLSFQQLASCLGLSPSSDGSLLNVIFICIDCEAYEFRQDKVTEIGVAVLDTRALTQSSASTEDILAMTKAAHYRPVEYSNLRNTKRVKSCPDCFGFGVGTWIKLADARKVLERIFADPTRLHEAAKFESHIPATQRGVVLVGHGLGNDETYLRRLGFSTSAVGTLIGYADTQELAGMGWYALSKLLAALDIHAVNLHNAGNDAVYTLQAMVKMATFEYERPGSVLERAQGIKQKPDEIFDLQVKSVVTWGGSATKGDEKEARVRRKRAPKAPDTKQAGDSHAIASFAKPVSAGPAAPAPVGPKRVSTAKKSPTSKKSKPTRQGGPGVSARPDVKPRTPNGPMSAGTKVAESWQERRQRRRTSKAGKPTANVQEKHGVGYVKDQDMVDLAHRLSHTDVS